MCLRGQTEKDKFLYWQQSVKTAMSIINVLARTDIYFKFYLTVFQINYRVIYQYWYYFFLNVSRGQQYHLEHNVSIVMGKIWAKSPVCLFWFQSDADPDGYNWINVRWTLN